MQETKLLCGVPARADVAVEDHWSEEDAVLVAPGGRVVERPLASLSIRQALGGRHQWTRVSAGACADSSVPGFLGRIHSVRYPRVGRRRSRLPRCGRLDEACFLFLWVEGDVVQRAAQGHTTAWSEKWSRTWRHKKHCASRARNGCEGGVVKPFGGVLGPCRTRERRVSPRVGAQRLRPGDVRGRCDPPVWPGPSKCPMLLLEAEKAAGEWKPGSSAW